jgi:uroporphyrinogen decarboxylase
MSPRERYIETLTFGRPDRIPLIPGNPRESTLANWRQQGMKDGAPWDVQVIETLGLDCERLVRPGSDLRIDFNLRPQFQEKEIERREGSIVVQDWKGNICEISDEFDVTYLRSARDFVTRSWIRCPVENRDDWLRMRERYDAADPGRFPEDFARIGASLTDRDDVLKVIVSGPFWIMREWCGFEGLCMLMIDQPDLVAEMAEFYRGFISDMFARMLEHVVPDHVQFSEDMAYKEKAMISPAMTRAFCQPCWNTWTAQLRSAGVPIIEIDSDGYVGGLIPIWIESGVHLSSPVEVAAGNDINAFRAEFGRDQAFLGGVDKRAMAAGGEKLAAEMKRIEPVVRSGGYIPGCDHGVPSDVSWTNFVEHTRVLARMSGWL